MGIFPCANDVKLFFVMGAFPFYSIIVTQSYGIVNKNRQQFKISLKSDNKYFYSDEN